MSFKLTCTIQKRIYISQTNIWVQWNSLCLLYHFRCNFYLKKREFCGYTKQNMVINHTGVQNWLILNNTHCASKLAADVHCPKLFIMIMPKAKRATVFVRASLEKKNPWCTRKKACKNEVYKVAVKWQDSQHLLRWVLVRK